MEELVKASPPASRLQAADRIQHGGARRVVPNIGIALRALRPRQWAKNLLLFAGILFAAKLGDGARWLEAVAAFAAFSLASSGAYLVNDVRDAPSDRLHPIKRARPVASGELSERAALWLAATLVIAACVLAGALSLQLVASVALFLCLQWAYTFSLKHIVLLDVLTISALFVLRAAAGAAAVHVKISPWLLVCTALLALFLALAKRRGELVLASASETVGRPVLEGYSLPLLDQLVSVVTASTVIAYSLYTFNAGESDAMMLTIPFVLFGVFRYLLLIHSQNAGEEPEQVLLSDAPILGCVSGWVLVSALILVLTS